MRLRQQLVDWAKGQVQTWGESPERSEGGAAIARDPAASAWPPSSSPGAPLELNRLDRAWPPRLRRGKSTRGRSNLKTLRHAFGRCRVRVRRRSRVWGARAAPRPRALRSLRLRPCRALQVHDRYLIVESDDGMMVIDQHALHERILYEHLRRADRVGADRVAEPAGARTGRLGTRTRRRPRWSIARSLARLGLRLEPFGGDTILVSSYPAMLANVQPGRGPAPAGRAARCPAASCPIVRDLFDELLHRIACKAAIKAGDRLTPDEIHSLLEQRHLVDDPHHCPHGRPTALVFTREELDKQFKRI